MIEFREDDPRLRLDEVLPGMKIFQYRDGFSYGTDAVLLSRFIKPPHADSRGVEFGTGTGVIPILLSQRANFSHITAFEIQEDYALLAKENVRRCALEEKIRVVWDDLKNARDHLKEPVDFVFTNPPYMKMSSGYLNEGERKLVARHEKYCTLESLCQTASSLLRYGGSFFVVHRPDRLVDLFCAMRMADIEPKELIPVHSHTGEAPKLVLCRGKKSAAPFLVVGQPIVLYP